VSGCRQFARAHHGPPSPLNAITGRSGVPSDIAMPAGTAHVMKASPFEIRTSPWRWLAQNTIAKVA